MNPETPAPKHPLLVRYEAAWTRYQALSATRGNDAVANTFVPRFFGWLVAKIDAKIGDYGKPVDLEQVLDALERITQDTEGAYPDLTARQESEIPPTE